ncbi:MAG: DinB family protein [Anaerolineae bacterium]
MLSEVEHYRKMMEDLRGQVEDLIRDLPQEALNWRPVEDTATGGGGHATNSLAVLAAHTTGSERFWIEEMVGRLPPRRDRDAEFATEVTDAAALVEDLKRVCVETRRVLSALTAADLEGERQVQGKAVPVRWCILHVIDHTALHLGHMQLTYQLWMGGQSGPSPRWYERLNA